MNMAGGPMIQQAGLKISMELIKRVQVVYVLGLFLVGKHRKKVHVFPLSLALEGSWSVVEKGLQKTFEQNSAHSIFNLFWMYKAPQRAANGIVSLHKTRVCLTDAESAGGARYRTFIV